MGKVWIGGVGPQDRRGRERGPQGRRERSSKGWSQDRDWIKLH